MKKLRIVLLLILICFLGKTQSVLAAEQVDDLFKELYWCEDNNSSTVIAGNKKAPFRIRRMKCLDASNHIYVMVDDQKLVYEEEKVFYNSVSQSPYSLKTVSRVGNGFSGILATETAKVTSLVNWCDKKNIITNEEINDKISYGLPENITTSSYSYTDEGGEYYQAFVQTKGNVFNTLGTDKSLGSYLGSNCQIYTMTIEDQGKMTECTMVLNMYGTDYLNFDEAGRWYDKDALSDIYTKLILYDGTNGKSEKLGNAYQYGSSLGWQYGQFVSGIKETELLPYEEITLPEDIKSIRLSCSNSIPEAKSAIFTDMPGKWEQNLDTIAEKQRDYFFYKSKYRMVSINGGEWYNIHDSELSPELVLKKGLNILYLVGSDTYTEDLKYRANAANNDLSYVFFFYWDGEDGYKAETGQDASLKDVQIYQGVDKQADSVNRFSNVEYVVKINSESGKEEKWIDRNSSDPYVWLNIIPTDPLASVSVENSEYYLGGIFKRLDSSKNYFDITITSADKKQTNNERIYINWTMDAPELASLEVKTGGEMEKAYDPAIEQYYVQTKEDTSTLTIQYTPNVDTKVTVFVDRVQKQKLSGTSLQSIRVPVDAKEIKWKVQNSEGREREYTLYLTRRTDNGISDQTKQRAKVMIDKMLAHGYADQLKNKTSYSYWDIFGAASIGEEYLDGMLAYNVTTHNFTQASDYAAVILELVMAGENPYNYLGTNYVEGLLNCKDNTDNFGPYSCNIWAMAALEAAGAKVPAGTVKIVLGQATSEDFDLDMRGWALYAGSPYKNQLSDKKYARCIQSIKDVQIKETTDMNGIDVTGVFENFFYTNRNIMSHACTVTGLVALGIDPGASEFAGENGSDAVSALEHYQVDGTGGWFYSPEDDTTKGGWNKDVVIAVGDLYHGSNVYQRYFLTEDKYKELVTKAEKILTGVISDEEKKSALQNAYNLAKDYVSQGDNLSNHGKEYYALQEALFAVDENEKPNVFLGTAEEREQVNKVKKAIDAISSYNYSDKDKLDEIKASYDGLKEERLFHYITNRDMLDKAYTYIEQIESFLNKVNKLGKINLSKTAKVEKARAIYDSLSEQQKEESVVKEAYETLMAAEKTIEAAKTADKVVQAIENLGSIIILESQEDIESVRAAYEGLTDEEKNQVTNLDKLEKDEIELSKILQREKDKEAPSSIIALIDAIGNVNQNSEKAITAARQSYDNLENEQQKQLVSNYAVLIDAEIIYSNLVRSNELVAVIDMAAYKIEQIEDAYGTDYEVNESNEAKINQAISDAETYLTEQEQKYTQLRNLIENYPVLTEAKGKLAAYEAASMENITVDDFVGSVELIGNVTLDSESAIQRAYTYYNKLAEEDQIIVSQPYEVLVQADTELTTLKNNYSELQEVSYTIFSIGTVSLSDTETLTRAQELYTSMSEDSRQLMDESVIGILNDAINSYNELVKEQDAVNKVIDAINQAAEVADLSDEEIVAAARKSYDSFDKKEIVTNYLNLVEAEKLLQTIRKEKENQKIANEVVETIKKLSSVTDVDIDKIEAARIAYDALTDSQKILVTNVSILEQAEVKAESWKQAVIKLSVQRMDIQEGENVVLKAEVSADKMKISWTSSDSSVATVKDGVVTGIRAGAVVITATLQNGNKATCNVTVKAKTIENPADSTKEPDKTTEIPNNTVSEPDSKLTLKKSKVTVYVSGLNHTNTLAVYMDGKIVNNSKVSWKSSKSSVAIVSKKGVVTGKKKGTATITAFYRGKSASCKVTVKKLTRGLSASKATVYTKGANHKLALQFKENGSKINVTKLTWKSSKKSVASVSKKGVITGRKPGKVTITAKYKGKSYSCKIKVKKPSFKLKKTKATIKKGKKVTIKSSAVPKATVKYTSMNKKIATVSSKGVVLGKKKGTTKIKVTCNGIKKYFTVTVK